MNSTLARETLQGLYQSGVRELCVCPGSRNAPWIELLCSRNSNEADDFSQLFRTYYFFEERSAAFFALGRIRASGRPVGVMTTSGTAAAELLPATVEAYYSGLPLVLLTADRPRRFRGTGAPQTAEQVGLFGIYCRTNIDLDAPERLGLPKMITAPLHLNVCFEEPTLKETKKPIETRSTKSSSAQTSVNEPWNRFFSVSKNPIVVVGALQPSDRERVTRFLLELGAPTYFEALSGLREKPELSPVRVHLADRLFARAEQAGYLIDGVIRIGGIPTHRLWRDLEDRLTQLPVLNIGSLEFAGLSRPTLDVWGSISESLTLASKSLRPNSKLPTELLRMDQSAWHALTELLCSEPQSEPGMIHRLSDFIPENSRLFLGNSLPIREWDLAATSGDRSFEVFATRGVNGIDGQISTFLGLCDSQRPNWALLGDLTVLYDLAGPWILPQLSQVSANLVVMNNGGGKIFDRLYKHPEFQNQHTVRFGGLSQLWGLDYTTIRELNREQVSWTSGKSQLLELLPEPGATARFWKEYAKI